MKKKVETLVHLASMTKREVYAGRHKLCEQKSAHVEYRLRVSHCQTKKSHLLFLFCIMCEYISSCANYSRQVNPERLTKSRLNLPWFILHRIGRKPDPCIRKGQPIQTALFLLGIWLQKVRNADWVGWVLTTVAYSSRSAGGWVLIFWFFTSPDLNNYEEK